MERRLFLYCLHYTFLYFALMFRNNKAYSASLGRCAQQDALALFQFMQHLSISNCSTAFYKPLSWNKSVDCCEWERVTCDRLSGYVVGLDLSCSNGTIPPNSTLFQLHHLQELNLAHADFMTSSLPYGIGQLTSLTHLNLSHMVSSGITPSDISFLSRLVSLDLSRSYMQIEHKVFRALLQNLTKLEVLSFTSVRISSEIPVVNMSTSLRHLDLSDSHLYGELPNRIFRLPNLQTLLLEDNSNLSVVFPKLNSSFSTTLKELKFSSIGTIRRLDLIDSFKSLSYLDLSSANLVGELPNSIGNLKSLTHLLLFWTNLSGSLPNYIGNLKSLTHLDLYFTNISGKLPDSIGNLTSLTYLDLSKTRVCGELPYSIGNLTSLSSLHISGASLSGKLPDSIGNLVDITVLSLSHNNLVGEIPKNLFRLQKLVSLFLQNNNLTGQLPDSIGNLIDITLLNLSDNNLNGEIPKNLSRLKKMGSLYLENNNFWGKFPSSILNLSELANLDVSSNSLVGFFPPLVAYQPPMLQLLNFSGNLLGGNIPSWLFNLPSLIQVDLSANKLKGPLTISICNMSNIGFLKLSDNKLNGNIPNCLERLENLLIMDLEINNFDGALPKSLKHCRQLRVLNVGNNNIQDTFPIWLMELPELEILILRSNKFFGPISAFLQNLQYPKLRILDVSYNSLTGSLPKIFFKSFRALMDVNASSESEPDYMEYDLKLKNLVGQSILSYFVTFDIMLKGRFMRFERSLNSLTTIDLSSNEFEGEIPKSITNLKGLILLNMSNNYFTGQIPPQLENLTSLEALDLSSNQLTGKIPYQLTSLTFLEILNLSQNHLVGPIPHGKQFDTFTNDSYVGNIGLCGLPLSNKCGGTNPPPLPSEDEDDVSFFASGFSWRSVLIGYGCGMIFGIFLGHLMYKTGKPKWLINFFGGNYNVRPSRRPRRS